MIHGVSLGRYAGVFPEDVEVHDGNRAAWELLLRLQEGESIRLLLHGPPGRGKTHMMAATLNEIERKWPMGTYVYWTMTRFVVARRMAIHGSYDDPVELCIRAHVVFLDDLGAERQTEWGIAGLYDILEERARKRKPIVVATNCSLEELEQFYGARTLHRLLGDDARIVRVDGLDRRFEQARGQVTPAKKWTDAFVSYESGCYTDYPNRR
mgnify:CR=1 FL=1